MIITGAEYFYGLAAATYVVASLVVAAVRLFHICRPYNCHPDDDYPGRKAVTLIYLSALIIIPYIVLPDQYGTWLLMKAYFLPAHLFFLAILLLSYFGGGMHWRKWHRPTFLSGVLAILSGPMISLSGEGVT